MLLSDPDREDIKIHIVKLVCKCGSVRDVKQQLCQALTLIAASDFPSKWPKLLPEVVQHLQSEDRKTVSGMLLAANSIMKRFRNASKTDGLYRELKYVLDTMAAPLTALFVRLGQALDAAGGDKLWRTELLESLRLACRIFFSLNWQDLPEFFEDHMPEWMSEFEKYLSYEIIAHPASEDDNQDEEGPMDCLQVAVVENVSLYTQKYEEEFGAYLPRFVSAIWQRLVNISLFPKHDRLAATSIRFVAQVISKQMHSSLFSKEDTLRQMIDSIVIPNMLLRDSDARLFKDSPLEYIARELESADSETRRHGACDLINAMYGTHAQATTKICIEHIATMLQQYASSPADHWRAKDAALHLITVLCLRAKSASHDLAAASDQQLNILKIYSTHVFGELVPGSRPQPVIVADAILFALTFRHQLPIEELVNLLPILGRHVVNTEVVIQSYAASCLERILTIPNKIGKCQLQPVLNPLFEALFSALNAAHRSDVEIADAAPWDNDYIMKAVMRLLIVSQDGLLPIAQIVAENLCMCLTRVCVNPRNPKFNHYLFESLAILVRLVCGASGSSPSTSHFEQILFPPFQSILQMDVAEFAPYVFQILALLLRYNRSLSDAYASLLPPILHPMLWERSGNVPALASLLEAYLVVGSKHIVRQNLLEPVLGVFQKLLASKQTETFAFSLLKSIVLMVDSAAVRTYLPTVIKLLITRLQHNRERYDFCQMLLTFLAIVAGKYGGESLAKTLESQQAGLLSVLVVRVFAPKAAKNNSICAINLKATIVGMTCILCEAPDFLVDQGDTTAWTTFGTILSELLSHLKGGTYAIEDERIDSVDDVPGDISGYNASFSKLHFGLVKNDDAFPEIKDVQTFVLSRLQQFETKYPHFQSLIASLHCQR